MRSAVKPQNVMRNIMTTRIQILTFIMTLTFVTKSQGSWNIKYVWSSSIDSTLIGQTVRPDFKHRNIAIKQATNLRAFIGFQDTGSVMTDNGRIKLREVRAIYPDHGVVSDQYLMTEDKKIKLFDADIISLSGQQMKLKFYTDQDRLTFINVFLDINQLDGLMKL